MSSPARTQARLGDADLIALLASVGAHVTTTFVGTGTFHCPKCTVNTLRSRSLTVHADGAAFYFACTRCRWKGGARLPFNARRHRLAQRQVSKSRVAS